MRPDAALGEMNDFNIVNNFGFVLQKCNKMSVFYKNVKNKAKNRRFCTVQSSIFVANFVATKQKVGNKAVCRHPER
jgi:hypothetical protein